MNYPFVVHFSERIKDSAIRNAGEFGSSLTFKPGATLERIWSEKGVF
jgi:hypothetical protein